MNKVIFLTLTAILVIINFNKLSSKGDLTRQNAIEVEVNLKGEIGKVHFSNHQYLNFKLVNFISLK